MNVKIQALLTLMELYAECPECGCGVVGNGKGSLSCDKGLFKRVCACGWRVEVREKIQAPQKREESVSAPETPAAEEEAPVLIRKKEAKPTETWGAPKPWRGFAHIRCSGCGEVTTTNLRAPATRYSCKSCSADTEPPWPAASAITTCSCGQESRYLTNETVLDLEIPCIKCGEKVGLTWNRKAKAYTTPDFDKPVRGKRWGW